jgi:hypothetical protein
MRVRDSTSSGVSGGGAPGLPAVPGTVDVVVEVVLVVEVELVVAGARATVVDVERGTTGRGFPLPVQPENRTRGTVSDAASQRMPGIITVPLPNVDPRIELSRGLRQRQRCRR